MSVLELRSMSKVYGRGAAQLHADLPPAPRLAPAMPGSVFLRQIPTRAKIRAFRQP